MQENDGSNQSKKSNFANVSETAKKEGTHYGKYTCIHLDLK